ncbi:MAG: hypothetical protein F2923_07735 [Actinobacteria bacterium]|nr:hypothetical protein [Actinomycetota bacterium]MTB28513.1 hypothetical protein [Actinomycetota bacterium]
MTIRRTIVYLLASVGVLTLTASALSLSPIQAASQPVHTGVTSAGKVLVNAKGKTLYAFSADTSGASHCSGSCAVYWPPATTTGSLIAHSADVKAKLGTIKRADNTKQITVNGYPVYTFAGDKSPGDSNGQGLSQSGGIWWVVSAKGVWVKPMPASEVKNNSQPSPNSSAPETSPYSY